MVSRCGGRLAVGTGDGNNLALQIARGEFDFANDGNAGLACLLKLRHVGRHARADDDEFLLLKGAFAVVTGFDHDAAVQELRDFVVEFLFGLSVGDGHPCAVIGEKKSASNA